MTDNVGGGGLLSIVGGGDVNVGNGIGDGLGVGGGLEYIGSGGGGRWLKSGGARMSLDSKTWNSRSIINRLDLVPNSPAIKIGQDPIV